MKQLENYAEQANACRDHAARSRTDEERQHFLQMAERWEELARQRAAQLHLEHLLDELLKDKTGNHNGGTAAA